MKFTFRTLNGANITDCTERFAHDLLRDYAREHGLDVHVHPGSWEGTALSSAFMPGGDALLNLQAVVIPQR